MRGRVVDSRGRPRSPRSWRWCARRRSARPPARRAARGRRRRRGGRKTRRAASLPVVAASLRLLSRPASRSLGCGRGVGRLLGGGRRFGLRRLGLGRLVARPAAAFFRGAATRARRLAAGSSAGFVGFRGGRLGRRGLGRPAPSAPRRSAGSLRPEGCRGSRAGSGRRSAGRSRAPPASAQRAGAAAAPRIGLRGGCGGWVRRPRAARHGAGSHPAVRCAAISYSSSPTLRTSATSASLAWRSSRGKRAGVEQRVFPAVQRGHAEPERLPAHRACAARSAPGAMSWKARASDEGAVRGGGPRAGPGIPGSAVRGRRRGDRPGRARAVPAVPGRARLSALPGSRRSRGSRGSRAGASPVRARDGAGAAAGGNAVTGAVPGPTSYWPLSSLVT